LRKNNYAHFQTDIYGIISSSNRVAVCAGYAYVFDSLARIAGVKSREVIGYTKSDYYH
jgi:transglutaminase-like putative cysteine protease